MSEQTYELNNFGKCVNFIFRCAQRIFHVVICLIGIGLTVFMLASPFVYIYYITQNNWNIMETNNNSHTLINVMAQTGFILICVLTFFILLIFLSCIWHNCGLNNFYQSFKRAIFYKKVVTEETTHVANPVTNTNMV